jgi:hypothetical protein
MRTVLTLTLLLAIAPLHADEPARGKLPALPAIVAVCRDNGFNDAVCNPSPSLAPLIGIPNARLESGNTGSLWVTVVGISFTSGLNEERFLLRYEEITGICNDPTMLTDLRDVRSTTLAPARHYFRITTKDREIVFWVPGGTRETNNVAVFIHAIFTHILPVTTCDLRPKE